MSECGCSSQKEDVGLQVTPGEGGEAATAIELGPSQQVHVGDAERDDDLVRIARRHLGV